MSKIFVLGTKFEILKREDRRWLHTSMYGHAETPVSGHCIIISGIGRKLCVSTTGEYMILDLGVVKDHASII
jgi:hypothetical protein